MDITIKSNIVDNIVDIINALCEKFGIALDWSAENILPKVKELISRFAAYRISVYSACLIIAAILVAIFYKMWYKNKDGYNSGEYTGVFIVICIIFIAIFIVSAVHISRSIWLPELEIYRWANMNNFFKT